MLTVKKLSRTFSGCPHPETIRRWVRTGLLVNGVRVRLECEREGGRMVFTDGQVAEFRRKLRSPITPETATCTPSNPAGSQSRQPDSEAPCRHQPETVSTSDSQSVPVQMPMGFRLES